MSKFVYKMAWKVTTFHKKTMIELGVFVVYQALPRKSGKDFINKIGWLFVLSSLANIAWIFLWQYEYLIYSVPMIFLLLASLIAIYLRLNIGRSKASTNEKLAVHLPFSVYLGWLTIATIANVAVMLVSIGWDGLGINPETWAIIVLIVALIIGILVVTTRRDPAYGLVFVWALVGISVNQTNPTIVLLTQIFAIIIAIFVIAISILIAVKRSR